MPSVDLTPAARGSAARCRRLGARPPRSTGPGSCRRWRTSAGRSTSSATRIADPASLRRDLADGVGPVRLDLVLHDDAELVLRLGRPRLGRPRLGTPDEGATV